MTPEEVADLRHEPDGIKVNPDDVPRPVTKWAQMGLLQATTEMEQLQSAVLLLQRWWLNLELIWTWPAGWLDIFGTLGPVIDLQSIRHTLSVFSVILSDTA
jgi:hypothetical protein